MIKLLLTLIIGLLSFFCQAKAEYPKTYKSRIESEPTPIRIKFARGTSGAIWKGIIRDGNQKFLLSLGKGQSIKIQSDDVYTWSLITKYGKVLGCYGADYCSTDGEIKWLPYSGDYIISTDYRMSGGANGPSVRTRKVTVSIEVK